MGVTYQVVRAASPAMKVAAIGTIQLIESVKNVLGCMTVHLAKCNINIKLIQYNHSIICNTLILLQLLLLLHIHLLLLLLLLPLLLCVANSRDTYHIQQHHQPQAMRSVNQSLQLIGHPKP